MYKENSEIIEHHHLHTALERVRRGARSVQTPQTEATSSAQQPKYSGALCYVHRGTM